MDKNEYFESINEDRHVPQKIEGLIGNKSDHQHSIASRSRTVEMISDNGIRKNKTALPPIMPNSQWVNCNQPIFSPQMSFSSKEIIKS